MLQQTLANAMPVVGPAFQAASWFGAAPQDVSRAALEAISLPGDLVRGGIGAVARLDPTIGARVNDNQEAFDEAMYRGVKLAGVGTPAVGLLASLPAPFAKFLTAQLFDPLNYVGMGVPRQALNASRLARAGLSADELASAAAGLGKTPDELLSTLAAEPSRLTRSLELLEAFEGKTQEAISALFGLLPKAAGEVGRRVPLHREVISDIQPDLTYTLRQSENLTDWATAVGKRAYLKQFERNLQDAVAQYKALGGDFSEIDPSILPTDLAQLFNEGVQGSFGKHVRALGSEREKLEKIFTGLWSARRQAEFPTEQFAQAGDTPLARLTAVLDDLGIPHGEIASTVDLLKATQGHLMDADWRRFDELVRSYPAGDILLDNPLDLVLDRVVRDRAGALGITEPTGISKAWQTGTALFNEQALQSISYLLTNALGGLGMGALEGVNPFQVARNLVDNFAAAARGERVYTSGTRNLAAALGLLDEAGNPIIPRGVTAEAAGQLNDANPTRLYTGTGLTASQAIGAPLMTVGGGVLGGVSGWAASPDDASAGEMALNVLGGALTGGGIGAAMPTLSKYLLQRFARATEDVMRQSAWELGTRNQVLRAQDQLDEIIRAAYRDGFAAPPPAAPGIDLANTPTGELVRLLRERGVEPPSVVTSVTRDGPVLEPDWSMIEAIRSGRLTPPEGQARVWADQLFAAATPPPTAPPPTPSVSVEEMLEFAHALDGLLSPQALRDALAGAGVSDEAAQAAFKAWQDTIHRASQAGVDLSNTIHFDYANLNNLEELVRQFVPFSTWSMKAFPFFARHIAEHPVILTSVLELGRQSQEMREDRGLTGRVQGAVPYGEFADMFWSRLLGRPVDAYFNPTRGLVPFSDTQRNLEAVDDAENPLAAAYKLLTSFGPSAHPALEFIARTAGILGADTPARGLLRLAGPAQGVTGALGLNRGRGVNPEQALLSGEERLREALSGREVTDLTVTAAERRVDELALARTGYPITSGHPSVAPYLKAKADHRGTIWDDAMRDVSRERGARSVVGWLSNQAAPQAIVSREEAQIRGSRAQLLVPQELSQQVREINARNRMERIPDRLLAQVRDLARRIPPEAVAPEHVETVLAMPVAANVQWLFGEIWKYEQAQRPEVAAYSGAGSPEQRALSAQLAQYRNLAAAMPELAGLPPEQLRAMQALAESYRRLPPGLRPEGTVAGRYASLIGRGQERFRAANPELDAYLAWLAQNRGQGSLEEYVETRRR